jgi:hypothetical protein
MFLIVVVHLHVHDAHVRALSYEESDSSTRFARFQSSGWMQDGVPTLLLEPLLRVVALGLAD